MAQSTAYTQTSHDFKQRKKYEKIVTNKNSMFHRKGMGVIYITKKVHTHNDFG